MLARNVGAAMFAADRASRAFMQMSLMRCEPGYACLRMAVRDELLNGRKICQADLSSRWPARYCQTLPPTRP